MAITIAKPRISGPWKFCVAVHIIHSKAGGPTVAITKFYIAPTLTIELLLHTLSKQTSDVAVPAPTFEVSAGKNAAAIRCAQAP